MTDFERLVKQLGGNTELKPGDVGISNVQARNTQAAATASKPAAVTPASTGKTNWAKLLGGTLLKGADEAVSGVTSTVNNVIGEPAQEVWYMTGLNKVFGDTNPITKVNEIAQKSKAQNQQYFGENASKSKVAQLVDEYGTATAAAIPMAAVALMTAGSSLGAQATTAGLEATSAAAQAPGLATTISTGLKTMAKDPNYWTAYLQTAGNSYDTAKKDGASDLEASAYGMVNGLMNALVEVGGGGIQELPKALRNKGTSGVREWVKTMFDEGKENVVQGVIERGLQNVAYGKGNPIASTTNSNAIFNPKTAGNEFASGAVVGGILGGGQSLITKGINARTNVPQTAQTDANVPDTKAQEAQAVIQSLAGTRSKSSQNVTPQTQSVTPSVISALAGTASRTPQGVQTTPNIISILAGTAQNATTAKAAEATPETAVNSVGAKAADFGYNTAPTQTNSTDPLFTAQERTLEGLRPEDAQHKIDSDAEVDARASERYDSDYDAEKADLFGAKQDWDAADTVLAHKILANEVDKARKSGDWQEVTRLREEWNQRGTTTAQALRQRGRFANTPDAIVADAADTLYGENAEHTIRRLTPQRKAGIMDTVSDMAERYNSIEQGNTGSLVSLIERLNEKRRTTGMFSSKTSKSMDWALDYCANNIDGGEALLRDVAAAQIRNIAGDYQKISPLEAIKNYRIMGMLSKARTVFQNLISNNVFDPLDTLSNNLAVPLDTMLSKYTGTRSVATDKSWASSAKRSGSVNGAIKSYIQIGLDADASDAMSKYEQRSGRTFKMTGSPLERLLSTWAKYEGYALTTTDEFQKGGIKAETARGLNELAAQGLVRDDYADMRSTEISRQRTFQNDGTLSQLSTGARDLGNKLSLKDNLGGSFGVGDLGLPFAKVPANITAQIGNYSPLGLMKSLLDLGVTVHEAKAGTLTAEQQAKAVTGIGRGLTGTAALAGFAMLSAAGILSVSNGDDKDETALKKSSGVSGTQLNLSALNRWISGESTEWQDGDTLLSMGSLDPLNGLMVAGSMLADDYIDDSEIDGADVLNASSDAIYQSIIDLPAMSTLSDLINGYKYSSGDSAIEKGFDASMKYAAGQAPSFIVPNFIGGIAQGADNTVRDAYSSGSTGQQAVDNIKSKIPGLRETLPAKLDSFGREQTYTDNPLLNALNANVMPGQIAPYRRDVVSDELSRLSRSGQNVAFPSRSAPNSVNIGEEGAKISIELTPDEKRQYQTTKGQTSYDILRKAVSTFAYKDMTDEQKAKVVAGAYEYSTYKANRQIASERGESSKDSEWDKYADAEKNGVDFWAMWKIKHPEDKNGNGKADEKEQKAVINALAGLTPTQKTYLRKSIK